MKKKLQAIWAEIVLIGKWINNLFFVFLTTKTEPHVFYGYGHYWFAQKYADRRTKMSMLNKYCGGKFHYVLPAGNYSLIVLNSDEIQNARKRGVINKSFTIDKVLKAAYYVSTGNKKLKPENENK